MVSELICPLLSRRPASEPGLSLTLEIIVDYSSLAVTFAILIAASIKDLETREVSNTMWMVYAPLSLLLFIGRIVASPANFPIFLVSALATIVVSFLLFQFGVMGGADSKAFMCIGMALPVAPGILTALWQPPLFFYPFPIAVLVNSFLLSMGLAVIILARNLMRGVSSRGLFRGFEKESIIRKFMMLFTSYKTSFNMLESRVYLYPAEQVEVTESRPQRRFRFVANAEEDREKLVAGLQGYKDTGLFADGVWVTPGLPHLVFVTASLGVVLVLGDLLMMVFFRLVGFS